MEKNILMAMDDSDNAMTAVATFANTFTHDHKVTLFSVVRDTTIACEMYKPELHRNLKPEEMEFCALDHLKKEQIKEAQQKAREMLLQAGFEDSNIELRVELKKKGVARDILQESNSGYDTIVMGKRGLSGVKEYLLGSVSTKVLHSAKDVSVFVVE